MLKKFLPLLVAPLLLAGCATSFTNLTPTQQTRSANNYYQVEVALACRQQSMRWETIRPLVLVGTESYPMRPTPLMTNRWEALVPIPPGTGLIHYRYKIDYNYNSIGKPGSESSLSPEYTLRVMDQ